jgi:hypothetical protein
MLISEIKSFINEILDNLENDIRCHARDSAGQGTGDRADAGDTRAAYCPNNRASDRAPHDPPSSNLCARNHRDFFESQLTHCETPCCKATHSPASWVREHTRQFFCSSEG